MLPLIQKEMIEVQNWLTLAEFVDILAIAEMTPGPIAINSATFIGFRTAGIWGAIFATAGIVTPSLAVMILAATVLRHFYKNSWVQRAFWGLRPAVIALIFTAAYLIAQTAITGLTSLLLALAAFALLLFTRLHPIAVLALSAAAGIIIYL